MNRENTGAKPTAPPRLPPEAEQEILEALFEGMEIHSSEIAAILKKHGVCGDVEALQDSYRKRLGQRLMASLRDEGGKREVLANGKGSYAKQKHFPVWGSTYQHRTGLYHRGRTGGAEGHWSGLWPLQPRGRTPRAACPPDR